MSHTCPVCAYPNLVEPPRSKSGGGSYEICPCCGFQFGVDDEDRGLTYETARERWIGGGAKWWSSTPPPKGWKAEAQLATLASRPQPPGQRAKPGRSQ